MATSTLNVGHHCASATSAVAKIIASGLRAGSVGLVSRHWLNHVANEAPDLSVDFPAGITMKKKGLVAGRKVCAGKLVSPVTVAAARGSFRQEALTARDARRGLQQVRGLAEATELLPASAPACRLQNRYSAEISKIASLLNIEYRVAASIIRLYLGAAWRGVLGHLGILSKAFIFPPANVQAHQRLRCLGTVP
jgi:hypothetical protein